MKNVITASTLENYIALLIAIVKNMSQEESFKALDKAVAPRETNLPRCEKKCDQCLVYIEIDTNGEKEHVRKERQEWKKRQKEKSKK